MSLMQRLRTFVSESVQPDSWTPNDVPDMTGKVAMVTGGNSGIGFEVCRKLAENNCTVYLVARNLEAGNKAANTIRSAYVGARVEVIHCDLTDFGSIRACVEEVKARKEPLHVLVCNAGQFYPSPLTKTADGFEVQMCTNYYGHVYLVLGLLDKLEASGPGTRIVMVSSIAERFGKLDWTNLKGDHYKDSGLIPYSTTKLFKLMFGRELQDRLRGRGVDVFGVHPGLVQTPLFKKADKRSYLLSKLVTMQAKFMGQTPAAGAIPLIYAAAEPQLTGKGFQYFGPHYRIIGDLWPTGARSPYNCAFHDAAARQRLFDDTITILCRSTGGQPPNAHMVDGPTSLYAPRKPPPSSTALNLLTEPLAGLRGNLGAKARQVVEGVESTVDDLSSKVSEMA